MDVASLIIKVKNEGLEMASAGLDKLSKKAQSASDRTKDFNKRISGLRNIALGATATIGGIGGAVLKTSGDFQSAMNGVRAVSGATGSEFDALRAKAKELGATTAYSATEAGQGMEFLAMAGMNTQQVLDTIPNALNLASAGGLDLARSADILSNILTGMGMDASESARASDVLAKASARANVDVGMLGETMKYVAPLANELGLSLEQATAMAGALGNAGIQGSEAGTALRAIYSRFASDNKALGHFHRMGIAVHDANGNLRPMIDLLTELNTATRGLGNGDKLEIFKDMAGTEAMTALTSSLNAIEDGSLTGLVDELNNAKGSAKEMADIRMEGLNGSIKGLSSAWESLLISIGDTGILDAVTGIINKVADFTRQIANADPEVLKMGASIAGVVLGISGLVVALAGIGLVVPMVIAGFTGLATILGLAGSAIALLFSPITLIVGAIALLGAGVYMLIKHWDEVKAKGAELWAYLVEVWNGITQSASDTWDGIKEYFSGLWASITERVAEAWATITGHISGAWQSITSAVMAGWATLVHAFTNPVETLKSILSFLWESFKAGALLTFTLLVKVFVGGFLELRKLVIEFKDAVIDGFIALKDRSIELAVALYHGAINAFKSMVQGVISGMSKAVDGVVSGWNRAKELTAKAWQAMVSSIIKFSNIITTTATNVVRSIVNFFNGGWRDVLAGIKDFGVRGVQYIVTMLNNLSTAVRNGLTTAKQYFIDKINEILNFLRGLPAKMLSLGRDFVQGFVNGIKSLGGKVVDSAKSVGRTALNVIQREIDSHSPSREAEKLGKTIPQGFAKGIKKETKLVKTEAQRMAEQAIASVDKAIYDIKKKIALFGNEDVNAEIRYDMKHSDKYKGVPEAKLNQLMAGNTEYERRNKLVEANLLLEQAQEEIAKRIAKWEEARATAKQKMAEMVSGLGEKTELEKLADEEAQKRQIIQDSINLEGQMMQEHWDALDALHREYQSKRIAVIAEQAQKEEAIREAQRESTLSNMTSMFGTMFGTQSKAYRVMLAMEKGYAIKKAFLAMKVAVAEAMKLPFPENIPHIAQATKMGASIVSDIKAIAMPVGQAHDGIMSVPKSGTWNLEKGERVLPQHTAKALDRKLDADGKSGDNISITINVDAKGNTEVDAQNANNMSRKLGQTIKAVVMDTLRQEKRQGGMLSA